MIDPFEPVNAALVPPNASVTGDVNENVVPVNVNPVPAVYEPGPAN